MRLRTSFALIFVLSAAAFAQEIWKIDSANSSVQFSVRHFGINTVRGGFTKVSGNVLIDDATRAKDQVEAVIEVSSIDTGVEKRDNDLRSAHFFDAEKFPTITFKSRNVESAGSGKLKVTGDLTIHGVTKPVVLAVDGPTAPIKDPMGNQRRGASVTTQINRQDFGISADPGIVGDEISITLDMELTRPQPK